MNVLLQVIITSTFLVHCWKKRQWQGICHACLPDFITGTVIKYSLFHKLIQTSVEIKVLHLQNINTIFTLILIFFFRK